MEVLGCIILLAVVTVGIAWFCLERKEKQERREFEGRYFKVIDELNELEDEKAWLVAEQERLLKENNEWKLENGWLESERERLLKENNELEARCIELSKSAVIEELFEGAKEKLDEYVQKIARKK